MGIRIASFLESDESKELGNETSLLTGKSAIIVDYTAPARPCKKSSPFSPVAFRAGRQTPVFFDSSIQQISACGKSCTRWWKWAPPAAARRRAARPDAVAARRRRSQPCSRSQANMDPRHATASRSSASVRALCAEHEGVAPGVSRLRIKLANALTFTAAHNSMRGVPLSWYHRHPVMWFAFLGGDPLANNRAPSIDILHRNAACCLVDEQGRVMI